MMVGTRDMFQQQALDTTPIVASSNKYFFKIYIHLVNLFAVSVQIILGTGSKQVIQISQTPMQLNLQ